MTAFLIALVVVAVVGYVFYKHLPVAAEQVVE